MTSSSVLDIIWCCCNSPQQVDDNFLTNRFLGNSVFNSSSRLYQQLNILNPLTNDSSEYSKASLLNNSIATVLPDLLLYARTKFKL